MNRSWYVAGVLVVIIGVVGAISVGALGAETPVAQPGAADTDDPTLCPAEAASQTARYDLGRAFAGYPLTDASPQCSFIEAPSDVPVDGGPSPGTAFWSAIYGSCVAQGDEGCPYPLEVQSWPECARNLGSYRLADDPIDGEPGDTDDDADGAAISSADAAGPAWEPYMLEGYPDLPAAAFEGGTRLELYAGRTAVVIFADSDKLAARAARALAPAVSRESRGRSSQELQALAIGQSGGC